MLIKGTLQTELTKKKKKRERREETKGRKKIINISVMVLAGKS